MSGPKKTVLWNVLVAVLFGATHVWAGSMPATPFEVGLEAGPVWQSRNDVRIPGDV